MKLHLTMRRLKQQATKKAAAKGHTIALRGLKQQALGSCKCGARLGVLLKPYPGEDQISGSALTKKCKL